MIEMQRGTTKAVFALAAVVALLHFAPAQGTPETPYLPEKAKGFSATIRDPKSGSLVARLKVDRLYSENIKRGFLRLGVLSRRVFEGVRIELKDGDHAADGLREIADRLSGKDADRGLVLRRVQIAVSTPVGDLECEAATLGVDGRWDLTKLRIRQGADQPVSRDRGSLTVLPDAVFVTSANDSWCLVRRDSPASLDPSAQSK